MNIALHDGRHVASAHPGPVHARPGKAVRRTGLRLGWPAEPVVATAGEPLRLSAVLTNVGTSAWHNGGPGSMNELFNELDALAWIDDRYGRTLPAESSFRASVSESITIPAGGSLLIPVTLLTRDTERLAPGQYTLRALLGSLDLRAEPAALRLVAALTFTTLDGAARLVSWPLWAATPCLRFDRTPSAARRPRG